MKIAFIDGNTIWRRRLAEALADIGEDVTLVCPRGWGRPDPDVPSNRGSLRVVDVGLPPGWASTCAWPAQSYLAASLLARIGRDTVVVVTTPHYLPFVRMIRHRCPAVYYCSDDYTSYRHWKRDATEQAEAALVAACELSLFVSDALADRAAHRYGVKPDRLGVSMNATEPRFLNDDGHAEIPLLAPLPRPVVGVVGVVNERLDLGLLLEIAGLPALGTLLFVGPVDPQTESRSELLRLRTLPNVLFAGPQPHHELHRWTSALDVALIPYATAPINHFCSPMRLFDHVASGRPVVATAACPQVRIMKPYVSVFDNTTALVGHMRETMATGHIDPCQVRMAYGHLWANRAREMVARLAKHA